MGNKSNQILFGIIILLLAVSMFFRIDFGLNIGAVMCFLCGFAFLLLYRTKRKSWSLVLGAYLAYIGLMFAVRPFLSSALSFSILSAMFFIVPAMIFMTLFYSKGKRALLVPASLLLWIGLFVLIANFSFLAGIRLAGFFVFIALAFLTMYFLGKGYIGRWAVVFAAGLAVVALLTLLGRFRVWFPMQFGFSLNTITAVFAFLLGIVSIAIIFNALRRK